MRQILTRPLMPGFFCPGFAAQVNPAQRQILTRQACPGLMLRGLMLRGLNRKPEPVQRPAAEFHNAKGIRKIKIAFAIAQDNTFKHYLVVSTRIIPQAINYQHITNVDIPY